MTKEGTQKYIVSGNGKQYLLRTHDFSVRPGKGRKVRDAHGFYQVSIEESRFEGTVVHKKQNKYTVKVNGNTYHFVIDREESFLRKSAMSALRGEDRRYDLKSPMPGKIIDVFVAKGSVVKKGEPLLILEAMKMQNQVLSSENAKVTEVHIKKNDTVLRDQVLIEMELVPEKK